MKQRHWFSLLTLAAMTLVLTSCSGPSKFVDPEADMPFYEVVGVMPFNSLSQDGAICEARARAVSAPMMSPCCR